MEFFSEQEYKALGLKCGLEVHRQLNTAKKLFCHCPVRERYSDEYDATILRHMRPTLSELGEYDGTALMEFKTRKEIIYRINRETVCTYEMDDAPPFMLNREALQYALEIAVMLNLNLVGELHITRKQYLDGSIPTGFQRTTILGVDGHIRACGREMRINQLGLEEDACREMEDRRHRRVFITDRLSIPLIEIVTAPEIRTPQEAAETAETIRLLCRASGRVRTGLGRVRQDVNVSIEGGRRVEIKGVPRIKMIPPLVHNEVVRQKALLGIMERLRSQNTDPAATSLIADVTGAREAGKIVAAAAPGAEYEAIFAVLLRDFAGIMTYPTGDGVDFSFEVSERVRVIACLDRLPNIVHSEDGRFDSMKTEFETLKKITEAGRRDVVCLVWGDGTDAATGAREIINRAHEAVSGVPSETRQAWIGCRTRFERILPGPDRMYPDTDLPPVPLKDEQIAAAKSAAKAPPWEVARILADRGLTEDQAKKLILRGREGIFIGITDRFKAPAGIVFYAVHDAMNSIAGHDSGIVEAYREGLHALIAGFSEGKIKKTDFLKFLKESR